MQNVIFDDTISIVFEETKVKYKHTLYFDGSEPDESSPVYEDPITLTDSKMLRAKSIKAGWRDSDLFEQMIFKNNNHIIDIRLTIT